MFGSRRSVLKTARAIETRMVRSRKAFCLLPSAFCGAKRLFARRLNPALTKAQQSQHRYPGDGQTEQ